MGMFVLQINLSYYAFIVSILLKSNDVANASIAALLTVFNILCSMHKDEAEP